MLIEPKWKLFCLPLCMLSLAAAFAQANSSILGVLVDQADAVVPNATVTVTEAATGATRNAQTNDMGLFRVLDLLPGRYSVRVQAAGFKAVEVSDVVLASMEARDLGRVKLDIGTLTEQIAVTAQATPVQTATSERGSLVDGNQLNDIALKGRDTFGLMALVPGVVDLTADRSLAGPGSVANIYINGMASTSKNVTFDGVNQVDMGASNAVYVNPSMDAVAEVRVLTNGFQAEYGRNSGGTMNMVSKSGSRDFHGSAYWQRRHEDMNANSFFNNRSNIPRPIYRYFIGGATIGGPVYIPGHFNRDKGKLFFFWSEEFTRVFQPTVTSTANLPTIAERGGDFSNSRNAAGAVITIKDPTTGAPFATNFIPPQRIDPTGQAILNLFQKPNGYVNPAPGQQYTANFLAAATPYYHRRDDIVRIDYNLMRNTLIYGRFGHDTSDTLNEFNVSPGVGHVLNGLPGTDYSIHVLNTFSPTLVNEVNVGIGRNSYLWYRVQGDQDSSYFRGSSLNPPTLRPFPSGDGAGARRSSGDGWNAVPEAGPGAIRRGRRGVPQALSRGHGRPGAGLPRSELTRRVAGLHVSVGATTRQCGEDEDVHLSLGSPHARPRRGSVWRVPHFRSPLRNEYPLHVGPSVRGRGSKDRRHDVFLLGEFRRHRGSQHERLAGLAGRGRQARSDGGRRPYRSTASRPQPGQDCILREEPGAVMRAARRRMRCTA